MTLPGQAWLTLHPVRSSITWVRGARVKDLVEPVPLRPRAGSLTAAWVCSSSKWTTKKSSSSLTRPWVLGTPLSSLPPSARAAPKVDYTVSKVPFQACLRSCHFLARNSSHPSRGKPSPAGAHKAQPDLPDSFLLLRSAGPNPGHAGRLVASPTPQPARPTSVRFHGLLAWPGRHVPGPVPSPPSGLRSHTPASVTPPEPPSVPGHTLRQDHAAPPLASVLFLPRSLYRNLAGCVFADLPYVSVSPAEGSSFFLLVLVSALASALGMVLGI